MRVPFPLLLLCTLAVALHAPAQATRTGRFKPMPRDDSLKPPPAKTTGVIDFVGNQSYTVDQLKEPMTQQITEIEQQGLTRPRADDAAFYLAAFYRKEGFPDAEVNFDIVGGRLKLTIKEGQRSSLRHVTFVGNRAFDNKTLYEYMIGGTEERTAKEPKAVPFVEGDMGTGVARIRGLYESEGRLDAKIEDPVFAYSADRSMVDVTVHLTEGPRYIFGKIEFLGEPAFGRDQLINALGEQVGDNPYTTQRLNAMEHNLLYYYKSSGYFGATVAAAGDPKTSVAGRDGNRLVPVVFTIKAGPVYHYDGMTVTGLDRLHHNFFEHRFAGLTGKVYTPPLLDEKYRELLSTGLFKNLRMTTVALPSNEVRTDFMVEEAKAKEVGFSLGFSSYEGALAGIHLADRDFLGAGRPLSLSIDYSQRGLKAELLWVDQWFLESAFSLRSRLFAQSRTETGYDKTETGFRADLTRKLTPAIELGVFLEGKNVDVTSEVIDPIYLGPTSYQVISLGVTQNFDFRKPRDNPLSGYIVTGAIDGGTIAGQIAYARATARVTYFTPLFSPKVILAVGLRGGLILPFTEVPIDERFFLGGATTVRSFQERQLGPREPHGNPVGGEAYVLGNVEVTFPLKDALRGAVFFDAGNLMSRIEDAGFNDLRYGIGVGLRYALPVGPIRLDAALNPNPKMDEKWGAVQFSIGLAF